MKKNAFKVTEVKPRIFYLEFKKRYDCNMMFLRYQEYYESPNSKFRDHPFEILDFIEWYSKAFGKGAFTYMVDWAGFNIPARVIKEVWDKGIMDRNIYDYEMLRVYRKCRDIYPDEKFYVIAAVGKSQTMRHEIAHGFYYTTPEYKKAMDKLVKGLSKPFRKKMNAALKKIGYTPKVYVDETQAYMSTGVPDRFKLKTNKKQLQPFIDLYNKYYNA